MSCLLPVLWIFIKLAKYVAISELLLSRDLVQILGQQMIDDAVIEVDSVPILGFLQTVNYNSSSNPGRVVVYGDSSCLDNTNDNIGIFNVNNASKFKILFI